MSVSIAPSPFGSLSVSVAETGSTLAASVLATSNSVLTMALGVPGPQGPQGPAGEGVPAGGSAGAVLAKIDGTDYNTEWVAIDTQTSWGEITGTLSDQGDLQSALDSKADVTALDGYLPLSGGNITGDINAYGPNGELTNFGYGGFSTINSNDDASVTVNPTSVTVSQSGSYVQIAPSYIRFPDASFQYVAFPGFANAALTGNPTAPTPTAGDNDTSIATTAFVTTAVANGLAGGTAVARNLEFEVRNQSGSTVAAGSIVYVSGATGNKPLITKAQANNDANSAQTIGFVKSSIANNGTGYVIVRGILENIDTSALSEGAQLYLSPTTAGAWTTTKPYAPDHLVYVGIVIRSHPTQGTILVAIQNGYELAEIHDVSAQTPSNDDLLAYETSSSLWKNKSFSTLGLLTSATAASTYQTISGMSSYLTTASAASTYQTQAGMSSYLTTASAASTYQTQAGMTSYLSNAGNLSGLTSVSTARTNLGLTSLATASFATNAQAQAGTSASTAMTPASSYWADKRQCHSIIFFLSLTGATSGTGASALIQAGGYAVAGPTSASGYGVGSIVYPAAQRGVNRGNGSWNWSKSGTLSFRISKNNVPTDSNAIFRATLGKASATPAGDPTTHSVGIKMSGSGAIQLIVHNGTTLTSVTSTSNIVPSQSITYDIRVTWDGSGNVNLYVNDALEATTALGPTGTSGTSSASYFVQESQNSATITGTPQSVSVYNLHFEFAD